MHIRLFTCPDGKWLRGDVQPVISTSLGDVRFTLTVNETNVLGAQPSIGYQLTTGARIHCWSNGSVEAELLLCRPTFQLPEGMQVADCWAATWRIRAIEDLSGIEFRAFFDAEARYDDWSPDTGEGLTAMERTAGAVVVHIGMEDERWLHRRAMRGDGLPARLLPFFEEIARSFPSEESHLNLGREGLIARFPGLREGELVQFHFVVAWGVRAWPDDVSTWFAVDREPSDILAGAGVSMTGVQ